MEKVEARNSPSGSNGSHEDVEKWSAEARIESTNTEYVVDPEAEKQYVVRFFNFLAYLAN